MPQEYKITRVSELPPREYTNDYGTTYYIKVALEGHEKPVEIGKKNPDALKVGDTVFGTVTPTQYDNDKFKSEKRQFTPGGGGKTYQPRDDAGIRAQFAIKTAVQAVGKNTSGVQDDYFADVETYAKKFYSMIDRVKNNGQVSETFSNGEPLPEEPPKF